MIKSTAAAKKTPSNTDTTTTREETKQTTKETAPPSKSKWNALQDDYMLNSKLKDWDKESSDEEEEEDGNNEDWASDNDAPVKETPSKKRRVSAR